MDFALFHFLRSLIGRSPFLDDAVLFFARFFPYFIIFALFLFLLRKIHGWKKRLYVFLTLALSVILSRGIIVEVIRFFYHRSRPFLVLDFTPLFPAESFSFPSGHAAFFFALSFVIFYLDRRWGYWFLGASLLNGLARVVSGVHWPSDILAGILLGFLGFLCVYYFLNPKRAFLSKKESIQIE